MMNRARQNADSAACRSWNLRVQIVVAAIKERHNMETDMEKVGAASQAFYAALNARDPSAMANVWAHTPYVTYSEIALGWDAVNKAWEEVLRKVTSKIDNYH
jgi:hypothetical protein